MATPFKGKKEWMFQILWLLLLLVPQLLACTLVSPHRNSPKSYTSCTQQQKTCLVDCGRRTVPHGAPCERLVSKFQCVQVSCSSDGTHNPFPPTGAVANGIKESGCGIGQIWNPRLHRCVRLHDSSAVVG